MSIQYILNWIAPVEGSSWYSFSVCEARLTFRSVSELQVSMDWGDAMLDAEIDVVRILKSRTTPNGSPENYYEIEFNTPEARIALWSTGYEVVLLEEPQLSSQTSIPISDEA